MGKIINPVTLSKQFGISPDELDEMGVIDVILTSDTLLFIDPMLLSYSKHSEMCEQGSANYVQRFETIIKLLALSKVENDVAWKGAKKLFNFSEISWTCLGYSSGTRGSGFGKDLVATTLNTAAQIVALGVEDTDLFMALALFEEGIGPDRISDMTTNIILDSLLSFNFRVLKDLNIPTSPVEVNGKTHNLIYNPYSKTPLLLVPTDIVRDLPIANSWSDIARVTRENEALRESVNSHLGEVFATMTKRKKQAMKKRALQSKAAFSELLALIKCVEPESYNFHDDRNGEVLWTRLLDQISQENPFDLSNYSGRKLNIEEVKEVVDLIIEQFKDLIENKGLWKELWTDDGQPKKEKTAQRLLFAVAHSYCKANDLDLTPEADAGNGPVDFKVSQGHKAKVLVEIKLSKGAIKHGYEKQLEVYKKADDTDIGIFLIIDIGKMGRKYTDIQKIRRENIKEFGKASDIVVIDGNIKESASKR